MRPPKKRKPAGQGGSRKQSKSFGRLEQTKTYGKPESVSRVVIGSLAIGEIEYLGNEVWAARGADKSALGHYHSYADAHGAVWRAFLRAFTGTPSDTSGRTH